jgi:hypothetical protein
MGNTLKLELLGRVYATVIWTFAGEEGAEGGGGGGEGTETDLRTVYSISSEHIRH